MSSIVKGNVGSVTVRTNSQTGDEFTTVTVYDNHQRYDRENQRYIDTGRTVHEISFNKGHAQRIAASFRTGDAVLAEVDNQRTDTFTDKHGVVVPVIRSYGIDLGLSARYKAFGDTQPEQ